jgi:archaellum component FlaG (FlaF/FlaG flagellin family)
VSETVSTSILTTAAIILAVVVATVFLSFAPELRSTINAATYANADRLKTGFKIIFVASNSTQQTLLIWLKNVGLTPITINPSTDVFIWNSTFLLRPTDWEVEIMSGEDGRWSPQETAMFTVDMPSQLIGEYHVKVVVSNSVEDQYDFSV